MGCGKSKHADVASNNTTVLQRKKSNVTFKEIETETKDINNNNVDNVSSVVEVEQKESESVKENDVVEEKKDGEVKAAEEKTNDEAKKEGDVVEEHSDEVVKNDDNALIENNDAVEDNNKDNEVKNAGEAEEKTNDEGKKEGGVVEEHSDEVEKNDDTTLIENNDEKINDAHDVVGTEQEKILAEENEKGMIPFVILYWSLFVLCRDLIFINNIFAVQKKSSMEINKYRFDS
jgi:hypothetical protein